jgi:hypothetical protein
MQTAHATTTEQSYYNQAVCYRCQYVGMEATSNKLCPLCSFPLILETKQVGARAPRVRDILDRSSVELNAPPLPGVDAEPREAQIKAEQRRRRITEKRRAVTPPPPLDRGRGGTTALEGGVSRVKIAFALGGAVVAGLVTAVLVHGGM